MLFLSAVFIIHYIFLAKMFVNVIKDLFFGTQSYTNLYLIY